MDKELDELLDSALDDFDKKIELPKPAPNETSAGSKVTIERTNLYVDDVDDEDRPPRPKPATTSAAAASAADQNQSEEFKLFEEIFADEKNKDSMKKFKEMFEMLKTPDEAKLMENFEKVMADLASDELDLDDDGEEENEGDMGNIGMEFFKNLAEKTFQSGSDATTTPKTDEAAATGANPGEKANPFQKVLSDLNKNSEKVLKDSADPFASFGKEFLSSLENETSNLDSEDGAASFMMQPILSMLFSKEILYPSLKMMSENYDKYIEDKKTTLSEQELDKCRFQKECIKEMCSVYEQSKDSDSKEEKSNQLKKILDLLEKCGVSQAL